MLKVAAKCGIAQFTPVNKWLLHPLKYSWCRLYPICCNTDFNAVQKPSVCECFYVPLLWKPSFMLILLCVPERKSLVGLDMVNVKDKLQVCQAEYIVWEYGIQEVSDHGGKGSESLIMHEPHVCMVSGTGWNKTGWTCSRNACSVHLSKHIRVQI